MRYKTPKIYGYVYRRRKKCNKLNCRCHRNDKYRHTSYQLQYREWVDGQWKQRSEYVQKSKVRALRARIKRAKQKDLERQQSIRNFLEKMPKFINHLKNPPNLAALLTTFDDVEKLIKNRPKAFTWRQHWTIFALGVDLVGVLTGRE